MEMSSLIIMNPEKTLVLLDDNLLYPSGKGSPAEVAKKLLKRDIDESEFRLIAEYRPNDLISDGVYQLLTTDVSAAIPDGFHFVHIGALFDLMKGRANRMAGWMTIMALHPDTGPVVIGKLPLPVQKEESIPEMPIPEVPEDDTDEGEEEAPKKKKRGK